ncbi:EG45-like domain containing protein [Cynara cardunculus var. scolymus]|uniref:Barwin-like endoglucanase n=1 Tax=Cynara cardunculus var. scolymus TaxID=59895 RepID=A0A118K763_CYNCS|nr:EG45-like domain containing protein [Cynara cardunculus var. scolymus]KVI11746.1 Barwin-like endoglucanase [Cynara cardunculus var. scolymus]
MGLVIRALILIGMVACLTSIAHAIAGEATYYTVYKPSSCYGDEDHGNMIAAVNSGLFANKAACGRRYRVRCTGPRSCKGGTVDVTVVDLCPGCGPNGIDLSQEAFSVIADPSVGRINIDYTQI